ncbi:Uncharacterised protein [Mycobacterium tuberculosis]|nr:Uncharacterised protein [Mycobacterium tuberculosis]
MRSGSLNTSWYSPGYSFSCTSADPTHSTRRRLPSMGISRSSVPCSTSSGAVNAGARRGMVSPTCSSARPIPAGTRPWCTSGSVL